MGSRQEFGEALRYFRTADRGDRLAQDELANCMSRRLSGESEYIQIIYRQYITDWEQGNGRYTPPNPQEEWSILLSLLGCLIGAGKITSIDEANALLSSGNYRPLTPTECHEVFGEYPVDPGPWMPPLPEELIGRDQEIQEWCERLTGPRLLHAITGRGGAGKTALALTTANSLTLPNQGQFQTFIWDSDKRQVLDPRTGRIQTLHIDPLSRETFLVRIARQLRLEGLLTLDTTDLERELGVYLRQNPVLLVVDNLETVPEYRWVIEVVQHLFQPVRSGCASRVLMTSRETLTNTGYDDDITQETIRGLSDEDSWSLLESEAEAKDRLDMMTSEPDSLRRIIHVAEGLPLILKMVVSRYALGISLEETATRLQSATSEEQLYRFLFHDLWFRLSRSARIVAIIAADIPGSISREYLRGHLFSEGLLNRHEFDEALSQLEQMSILMPAYLTQQTGPQARRYTLHSLTRHFIQSDLPALWGQAGDGNAI